MTNNTNKNINAEMLNELQLYAVNTRHLYDLAMYTCKTVAKKHHAGIFDKNKALKAFYNLACEVVKSYNNYFKLASKWYLVANTATRRELAEYLYEYYQEDIDELAELMQH